MCFSPSRDSAARVRNSKRSKGNGNGMSNSHNQLELKRPSFRQLVALQFAIPHHSVLMIVEPLRVGWNTWHAVPRTVVRSSRQRRRQSSWGHGGIVRTSNNALRASTTLATVIAKQGYIFRLTD
eukprot:CAMPEP_0206589554 /NCGR_PEP_ID=MMETSP0325_2-20121206/39001_1 /ASSEMBLY_ACC=CAM_ASM_000347 /TAXON_ID=2866 /ORGANISM="Crypthecodinium cohnii, Strain Seligo" /LENGTH=123 /DNA_ID=CAMNT_0054098153 /DNA_START=6 /DNA_END=377 /DNA_ORIENTATION=-